ncbi:MAG: amidohydrolase family protein [Sulfurovum sp.]|nr:amidohydrolase family protein [Sulfurovum sp.]
MVGKHLLSTLTKEYPHIILSIGHSNASYEKCKESFAWGVSHATHLFNAMSPYHHRKPGIVGAVLDADVTCDMIADLVHTHPSTLELVQKIKKNKLILITDAMRAGCMKCGTYDLGGRKVEVSEGKAVLEDGTLAGSVLKMNEALRNMLNHTSMNMIEAVYSVTKAPAQKLAILKGELCAGYDADIVIFDESFCIRYTIVAGELKYKS